jgi:hypothetical protein
MAHGRVGLEERPLAGREGVDVCWGIEWCFTLQSTCEDQWEEECKSAKT